MAKYIPPHKRRQLKDAEDIVGNESKNRILLSEKLYIKYPSEKIKELSKNEPNAIAQEIMLHYSGFEYLVEKLPEDGIELMMQILANACSVVKGDDKNSIVNLASKNNFHNCAIGFVSKLTSAKQIDDKFFENAVIVFESLLECAPLRACEVLPKTIEACSNLLTKCYDDDLRTKPIQELFRRLNDKLESWILDNSSRDNKEDVTNVDDFDNDGEPPNDFRVLSVYPTENDILVKGFLRKNVIDRRYKSVHHYLDVQFRLLKEDYVMLMREGVEKFVKYTGTLEPIIKSWGTRIYPKVRLLKTVGNQLEVLVQLQNVPPNWYNQNKKTFNVGALLCFSDDHFKSLFVGKVIWRNNQHLEKGEIVVKFEDERYQLEQNYAMVETSQTFEMYYHVLKGLQNIDEAQFPMKKYIIDLNSDIDDVKYLKDVSTINVNNISELNKTQLKAFHAALTKEFVIIQGASGTGKTFLGKKIIETLLINKENWYSSNPILVVCNTKENLHTFFEQISAFTDDMILINRLENQNLTKFTLKEKRKSFARNHTPEYARYYNILNDINNNSLVINLKLIFKKEHNFSSSWFSNASNQEMIDWLLGDVDVEGNTYNTNTKINEGSHIEVNDQENENHILISVCDLEKQIDDIKIEGKTDMEKSNLTQKRCKLENQLYCLKKRLSNFGNTKKLSKPQNCDLHNPHSMNADDRWQLYWYWLRIYETETKDTLDLMIMKKMMVVGVTAEIAARLQTLLSNLKSSIVIINEAAAIRESNIVVCLTPYCQHLILFGDYLQEQPFTLNFNFGKEHNLQISLLERMASNKFPCHVLGVQYDMDPKITNLLVPLFYPKLENHSSVYDFQSIVGVVPRVYFIDHRHHEQFSDDFHASNKHEAKFLTLLARYLIQNGHKPQDITILSASKGQLALLEEQKHNLELLEDVKIQLLNQLAVKKNKIILLSLVRNNEEGKIGVVKSKNIVCTALSRAREGLYMMGNMDMLSAESEVWLKLKNVLISQNSLGTSLLLRCQIHTNHETMVTSPEDFEHVIHGGCNQICGTQLQCGHFCTMVCHIFDRHHKKFKCNQCV